MVKDFFEYFRVLDMGTEKVVPMCVLIRCWNISYCINRPKVLFSRGNSFLDH